jgi:hypothetical protein
LVEIKEKFSVRNHTYRATKAGYWKAGTDRPMYYKGDPNSFIAMEKTLAFFQGKEPNYNEAESNTLQTQVIIFNHKHVNKIAFLFDEFDFCLWYRLC